MAYPILGSCALTLGYAGLSHRNTHTRYVVAREKTQRTTHAALQSVGCKSSMSTYRYYSCLWRNIRSCYSRGCTALHQYRTDTLS